MKITQNEIDMIAELSQDCGMTDTEIALIIGCSRATINRARKKHNIPIRNINNKFDKSYVCIECGKKVLIKRSQSRRLLCMDCEDRILKDNNNNIKIISK